MMNKESGGVSLLIGVGAHDMGTDEDEKELAAKAFLKAIDKKDPKALVEAFGELLDSCDSEYSDEDEPKKDSKADEDY